MSNDYEQQPDSGSHSDVEEGAVEAAENDRKSSGLIRAGLFGIILFLAVVGFASVINKWIWQPADATPVVTVEKTETPKAIDGVSPYKKLEGVWQDTRTMLDTEFERRGDLLAKVESTEKKITAAEQSVVKAESDVELALVVVEKAEQAKKLAERKFAALERETPEEAFEDAQLALNDAKLGVEDANGQFQRAKAEQKRIETTVSELRRAAKAADAAATASRLVVSAAESAQQAVNDNQDVMSEADGPAMSSLENDFFKEAEQQAYNVEKSARAAKQAVEVASARMSILKKQEADLQRKLDAANTLEKETAVVLAEVEKEITEHLKKLKTAENQSAVAANQLEKAQDLQKDKKSDLDARVRSVAVLKGELKSTKEDVKKAEKTLAAVESKFQETERDLKAMHRERAEKAAISLAALNAQLNEQLRKSISGSTPDHPIFDRLVFSSEMLFEQGSAVLGSEGKTILAKVVPTLVEVVKSTPRDVDWVLRVDGHTDNQPLSGNGKYRDNWELSQARALSVVRYLVRTTSLKPTQLSANGFGEYQPLVSGSSPVDLAKNRRIELTLAAR